MNNSFSKSIKFNIYAIYTLAWLAAASTIPGIYRLSDYFHESIYHIQFLNGIMMLFFSCSQIIAGPVSDTVGRKKILTIALILTAFGLFLCLVSYHFYMFCIGLLILGIGSGPLAIIPRAMAKDIYEKETLFEVYSIISFMTVAAWICSSLINTFSQIINCWKLTYFILFIYSLILLFISIFFSSETLLPRDRRPFSIKFFIRSYLKVLTNTSYMKFNYIWSIFFSCLVGGIYSYLPVLLSQSEVFEKKLTLVMSIIMSFYSLGILALRFMIGKIDIKYINRYSIILAFFTIPYFFILLNFNVSIMFYIIGFSFFSFCTGSLCSSCITQAISAIREKSISGYAAALIGISGSFGSSLVSTLLSLSDHYQNITLVILISIAIISSAYFVFNRIA